MWKKYIYFFAFSTVLLFQVCENLILAGTDFNIKSNDIKTIIQQSETNEGKIQMGLFWV